MLFPRFFLALLPALFVTIVGSGCSLAGYGALEHEPKIPVYYRIKRGDTIGVISARYDVPQDSLVLLNDIQNEQNLRVGRRILLGYKYPADIPRLQNASYTQPAEPASLRGTQPKVLQPNGELLWPLVGGRIVSLFGPRSATFHDGIDIAAPAGTPVFASHAGTVAYADDKLGGYGNLVILRHKTGLTTVYAHNRTLLVSEGDVVKRGQKIAEVGSTGRSSGPHLHFEVRAKDKRKRYVAVDPMPLLFKDESGVKPRYRVNESLTPLLAKLSS